MFNSYSLAVDAIRTLLDKELDQKIRNKVKKLALEHPHAKGIHDLRTRDLGGIYTFEFHLELDGGLNLNNAHSYPISTHWTFC